jgi:asparaginyl-tRNA synthetase
MSFSVLSIYQQYQELIQCGNQIEVKGWIRTLRSQKGMTFLSVNDGSIIKNIQVVFNTSILSEEQTKNLAFGSSIIARGVLVQSPSLEQPFELVAIVQSDIEICGSIIGVNPLPAKGKVTFEYLRTIPHLRVRTNTFGAISRIRHELAMSTHEFYGRKKKFILVNPPQITQNDCEGGGEAFQVTTLLSDKKKLRHSIQNKSCMKKINQNTSLIYDEQTKETLDVGIENDIIVVSTSDNKVDYSDDFFKAPAYLTVSGQLALETYCLALGGVYCYQSAFRADPSQTSRHVAEFTMLEVEISFADLTDNMNLAEEYIKHCIQSVVSNTNDDLKFLDDFYYKKRPEADKFKPTLIEYLNFLLNENFARMKYSEVMSTLLKVQSDGHKFDVIIPDSGVFDLKAEHERYLTDVILKKPVFVTHYPKEIKAFYMKESEEIDSILGVRTVECCDLLVPGIGEVLGGSCRTASYDKLKESMKQHHLINANESSDLDYYLDMRRFGTVEHCGFGIGMSRLLMMLTGMENIRDMIEFPRTIGSISF